MLAVTRILKRWAARFGRLRPVRSFVVHVVYPNIVRCLRAEIRPDIESPSGIAESFAWKTHSLIVLHEELLTGRNCAEDGLRSDESTRALILDEVVVRVADLRGDILEFGVSSGESLRDLAHRFPDRTV